jgi:hypothetical protein
VGRVTERISNVAYLLWMAVLAISLMRIRDTGPKWLSVRDDFALPLDVIPRVCSGTVVNETEPAGADGNGSPFTTSTSLIKLACPVFTRIEIDCGSRDAWRWQFTCTSHCSPRLLGTARHERWKTMGRQLTSFISAVLALACASAVSAQQGFFPSVWTAAGVTGIVDEADTNIYVFNSTGSVSIKKSVASGTLDIRFPVQTLPNNESPEGACVQMRARLRDTGVGARVLVRLIRLDVTSGSLRSIGEIDTNTVPEFEGDHYSVYQTCLNVPNAFPFDVGSFAYYVHAQLIKTTATANPGLKAVQICNTDEACQS